MSARSIGERRCGARSKTVLADSAIANRDARLASGASVSNVISEALRWSGASILLPR